MSTVIGRVRAKPEPADPLKQKPEPPDRLAYATGMLLDAADFEDEQLYHRGRLARALGYLHGAGTVAGLGVEWVAPLDAGQDSNFPEGREESLVVKPGAALDRLGRVIEVPSAACIRLNRWYEGQEPDRLTTALHPKREGDPLAGVVADLFIRFFICERGKTPAFASGPFDAIDAVRPSRLRDFYKLELVLRREDEPERLLPRDPWEMPPGLNEVADRWLHLQNAILGAWREGSETGEWGRDGLAPLREHVAGQDTTSLFLARLQLPADPPPSEGERPARRRGEGVVVDNHSRRFVYTAAAIASWLGLRGNAE